MNQKANLSQTREARCSVSIAICCARFDFDLTLCLAVFSEIRFFWIFAVRGHDLIVWFVFFICSCCHSFLAETSSGGRSWQTGWCLNQHKFNVSLSFWLFGIKENCWLFPLFVDIRTAFCPQFSSYIRCVLIVSLILLCYEHFPVLFSFIFFVASRLFPLASNLSVFP